MSEQESLESSVEKIDKANFTQKLDAIEEVSGINKLPDREEKIVDLFSLTSDDIVKKDKRELFAICYSLSRYSLYISDLQALYIAKYTSADKFLNRKLALLAANYNGFTFEERKMAALNDSANKLDKLYDSMVEWEMYANRFKGLSYKVEELIKRIENFTKL